MRLAGQRNRTERQAEALDGFRSVADQKLVGLPDPANLKNRREQVQDIEHRRNSTRQGDIDCLDFGPIWKCPIRDDQRVGVPDAGEQMKNLRIENTGLEHSLVISGIGEDSLVFTGFVNLPLKVSTADAETVGIGTVALGGST